MGNNKVNTNLDATNVSFQEDIIWKVGHIKRKDYWQEIYLEHG